MSDKEVSNEKEEIKKADIKIKNSALLYIIVPVVFVAVMLVFLIPAVIAADKAVDKYISELMLEFSNGSIFIMARACRFLHGAQVSAVIIRCLVKAVLFCLKDLALRALRIMIIFLQVI